MSAVRTIMWVTIGIILSAIVFNMVLGFVGGMLGWALALIIPFGIGLIVGVCTPAPWHKRL